MSSFTAGRSAEVRAARYLQRRGFQIVDLNWRTRHCEIDIVASRAGSVYLVEVKYRRSSRWGDAIDAVTPQKLRQMQFAAQYWIAQKRWRGAVQLAVVSIDGSTFRWDILEA